MKKTIAMLLVFTLVFTMAPAAFAADSEALSAANKLYALGLFDGTGIDTNGNPRFDLDRVPNRHEAVTMLVRLLGKEDEALKGTWEIPFTDVAAWARPYVGYAYANGLTSGTSATTYSGSQAVTAAQYLTFVLRALGYTSGTDFQWDKAWELSDKIGLTKGQYNANTQSFLRGDVTVISASALSATKKGSSETLLSQLMASDAVLIKNLTNSDDLSIIIEDYELFTDEFVYFSYEILGETFTNTYDRGIFGHYRFLRGQTELEFESHGGYLIDTSGKEFEIGFHASRDGVFAAEFPEDLPKGNYICPASRHRRPVLSSTNSPHYRLRGLSASS